MKSSKQSIELLFLSTLSLRRATISASDITCAFGKDFYPRSPCGERQSNSKSSVIRDSISIHALLAESDAVKSKKGVETIVISIHALLAESDWWLRCWQLAARDISIHALLAESDAYPDMIICTNVISIHALLAESDQAYSRHIASVPEFLSTLSLRRATSLR